MTSVYGVTFVGARAQVGFLGATSTLTCGTAASCKTAGIACMWRALASSHLHAWDQPILWPPLKLSEQVGNRLKERGFEDNQMLYKVSCYIAKVSLVAAWMCLAMDVVHSPGGPPPF